MRIAAVILAAGAASRYRAGGGRRETKLVEAFAGEPMVRRVARAAMEATDPVVVVTGHARAAVEAALDGLVVRFVHNADFAAGLSTSLRSGLAALGAEVEGAVILLGDMPLVARQTIERLIEAADAAPAAQAAVPVTQGGRGNPVLLRRGLFAAASRLTGDEGARRLLRDPAVTVVEVPMAGEATRFDIDEAAGFPAA